MRALLRRRAGRAAPVSRYGALELDPATREVRARGEPVELSAREFALLEALLARPGAILSRAQLEEKLYGWNEEVDSNAVEVHIHALRRKLGADSIRNVRGVGWMIAKPARVQRRDEIDPPRAAGLAAAAGSRSRSSPPRSRTYFRAREEANALFDYQLRQMAASLTGAPLAGDAGGSRRARPGSNALVVQIWDRNGVQLYLSQPQRVLPQDAQLGFTTVNTPSGDWRVFSTLAGGQVVQVAQPMSARRELAASMALRTIVPLLIVAAAPRAA